MYNILVCDDEADIVSALTIYLKSEGYRVFQAFTGREALETADREDIHLELKGDVLTIAAQHEENKEDKDEKGSYICRERSSSSFSRSFSVSGIREEDISATYENGVLQLTLPKQEVQVPQSRRIEIQ